MAEVEADQLKQAVERMHGGMATFAQFVPVRETFEGKTVWEGVVHGCRIGPHERLVDDNHNSRRSDDELRTSIEIPKYQYVAD